MLCDWAHEAIALHPFAEPTEEDREAAPAAVLLGARRLARNVRPDQARCARTPSEIKLGSRVPK